MEKVPFGKFGFIHRENKKLIFLYGACFLCLTAWSVMQWKKGSPGDFVAAENIFNEWTGLKDTHLIRLQKILKNHPELHAKYDGRVAQKLLMRSEQGLAASFAKASQKRVGALSPFYAEFSKCSLLISEKKHEEALAQTRALKEKLVETELSLLYGYTLLRIAFLEQLLGHTSEELSAWKEFQKEAPRMDAESLALLSHNFQKNDISLQEYIRYREEVVAQLRVR